MMLGAVIGLILLLAAAGPAPADHPEFTDHAELQALVADWERRGARVEVPARSRMGRDIHLVRIGTGPITLLMTNELHGNEPSGTEAFVRFAELLLGNQHPTFAGDRLPGVVPDAPLFRAFADATIREELLRRVTIAGFPMMDPDGAELGHTRDQAANSDYATRLTAQSAAIGHAFRTLEPDLLLDSHGGPNAPDLNIGYVKPEDVEPAVAQAGIDAAAVAWRTTDPLGIRLAYFEEWPIALLTGRHGDPFTSVDQAYYDLLTGVAPVTHESYALEGLPVLYTETVGLQSTDPSISVLQGASAQEASMAGLALEASGLLTGERAVKVVHRVADGPLTLDLPEGARGLIAVVHWGRGVAEDPSGAVRDHPLVIRTPDGREVARSRSGLSATRRSRAVALPSPPAERLIVEAELAGDAVLRVTWREPDPAAPRLEGILGPRDRVAYCLTGTSLWQTAAPRFGPPGCDQFAADRPPVAAPSSSPRRCTSRRHFRIHIRNPRRGRLLRAHVTVDGRAVGVRRRRGRLTAVVDLRGRPPGRYTVRIRVRTTRGTFRTLRRYRTCTR